MKKIAVIPAILTLGNAVCGFAAITYAGRIGQEGAESSHYCLAMSGWLIIAGMIFDAFDGMVARLSKTTSKFGAELDSLCDAVTFGVAPAFLLLRLGPGGEATLAHQTLAVIAAIYMACTILRLARFNVETLPETGGAKKFRGLPSPAAAGCIASLAVLRGGNLVGLDQASLDYWVEIWATLGALAVALLMVSRVPYPHLTKQVLRGKRPFSHLVQGVLALGLLVVLRDLALVLIFWGYAIAILGLVAWQRIVGTDLAPAATPSLEESPHPEPAPRHDPAL